MIGTVNATISSRVAPAHPGWWVRTSWIVAVTDTIATADVAPTISLTWRCRTATTASDIAAKLAENGSIKVVTAGEGTSGR